MTDTKQNRLWQTSSISTDQAVLDFTVGDDPDWDLQLVPYDCVATAAHVRGLEKAALMTTEEANAVCVALSEICTQSHAGVFKISQAQEDCHTALEANLTERLGDVGKKVHTGRSRNDQVIAATRLLVRDRLVHVGEVVAALAENLVTLADNTHQVLIPGYTHTRQGMPSSVGQLFYAYAEDLCNDLDTFLPALKMSNRGALGAASGYGVPLPLEREFVAECLGLEYADINTIHIQNTRGVLEAQSIQAMHRVVITLSRLAQDLIWFSSEAFGFFHLPEALTTGSSIMPQKRNPDVLELLRTLPATFAGRYLEATQIISGLPAGYHRDLQRTKPPLLMSLDECQKAAQIMQLMVTELEVNETACEASLKPEIFATDKVYKAVREEGIPFREAYLAVKSEKHSIMQKDEVLVGRTHLGAVGTFQSQISDNIQSQLESWKGFKAGHQKALKLLDPKA